VIFLWGYVKEKVYVPSLPKNLEELKIRIKDAVNAVTPVMISNLSSMAPAYLYPNPPQLRSQIYQLDNLK